MILKKHRRVDEPLNVYFPSLYLGTVNLYTSALDKESHYIQFYRMESHVDPTCHDTNPYGISN